MTKVYKVWIDIEECDEERGYYQMLEPFGSVAVFDNLLDAEHYAAAIENITQKETGGDQTPGFIKEQ